MDAPYYHRTTSTFTSRCYYCDQTIPFWDVLLISNPNSSPNPVCISGNCIHPSSLIHHEHLEDLTITWLGHPTTWCPSPSCPRKFKENSSCEEEPGHWKFPAETGFLETCTVPTTTTTRLSFSQDKHFGLKYFTHLLRQYGKILPVGSVAEVPGPGPAVMRYTGLAGLHAVAAGAVERAPLAVIEELLRLIWNLEAHPVQARQRLLKEAYEKWKLTMMGEVNALDEKLGLDEHVENQVAELMAQLNDRGFGYEEIVDEVERRLEEGLGLVKRGKGEVEVRRKVRLEDFARMSVGFGVVSLGPWALRRVLKGS